jgi:thioredoxin-like negative regulator of GroEL
MDAARGARDGGVRRGARSEKEEDRMKTTESLEELDRLKRDNDLLLLYVGGRSCGVCHALEGKLAQMLLAYPGILPVKVEAEDAPELAARCGVFSIPVLILFIQGKETLREAGIVSLDLVRQKIARYCALFGDT